MRLVLATLIVVMSMTVPAFANHFPPEFEYLNGTAPRSESPCFDLVTKEWHTCRVYDDILAGILYHVRFRRGEVVRVMMVQDGKHVFLFGDPEVTPRETKRSGE